MHKTNAGLFLLLWLMPTVALANPVSLNPFHDVPVVQVCILAEVFAASMVLWPTGLRLWRFAVIWYAINILTYAVLLRGTYFFTGSWLVTEIVVFGAEIWMAYHICNMDWLQGEKSRGISWRDALNVSVAGNLVSMTLSTFLNIGKRL